MGLFGAGRFLVRTILKGLRLWHIYEVSRDLQAKISASNAMGRLGSCLQDTIPGRIATIEDVAVCLRAMGMNESYVA
jgi:hypothetical protein